MDHKQESLQICRNTHWNINSTEKAIMKFQSANTLFSLTLDSELKLRTLNSPLVYDLSIHAFISYNAKQLMHPHPKK